MPGGDGTPAQMRHGPTLAFLRDRASRARFVTSVCTGSLILGAAGLLNGYRATSHWCVRDSVLPLLGRHSVAERVVTDRNRITAAGISAGLDFALSLAAQLRGEDYARTAQLVAEYAPQPPFDAGSPPMRVRPSHAKRRQSWLIDRRFCGGREDSVTDRRGFWRSKGNRLNWRIVAVRHTPQGSPAMTSIVSGAIPRRQALLLVGATWRRLVSRAMAGETKATSFSFEKPRAG